MSINFDNLTSNELKRHLAGEAQFLPSRSDRRFALSLASYGSDLSASQAYHARELLKRAHRFRSSGPKGDDDAGRVGTVGDIFSDDVPTVARQRQHAERGEREARHG